jgi:ABC-type glycerol-3-phosphate transport system substrate-binding protein
LKKVMLLAAMLAMVLAATVPALAQVTQVGTGNQACVQTAIQAEVGKVQISQYGDNVNIQNIAQECNINVAQVEQVVASASATAAPAAVQYQYPAAAQYQYSAPASPAAELPPTGGSSLIALGAGVLLVAGGLLARRIVR